MNKTKHTPGPWKVSRVGSMTKPTRITSADDKALVVIDVCGSEDSAARDVANALLIAAAPELLEALQMARRNLKPDVGQNVINFIDDAINKAKRGAFNDPRKLD